MHALVLAFALAAPPDKPPTTLDEKIAAALKNHPDIKAAEAKRLLAEAELEQARLVITQKVSAASSRVELAKAKLIEAEEAAVFADRVLRTKTLPEVEKGQYAKARPALIGAKAELAAAELELQQLVGKGGAVEAKAVDKPDAIASKMPAGPAVDKLEAALMKSVKLDVKGMDLPTAMQALMAAAGVEDIPVGGLKLLGSDTLKAPPKFGRWQGEQTFAGWAQLLVDEFNKNQTGLLDSQVGIYNLYVREYGLLVEREANAPKDAITLTEFVRAVRAKQRR